MTRTLRRIIVPLDGSPLAERALPVAVSIAHRAHAPIELVGVQPLITHTFPGDAVAGVDVERDAARGLERYLEQTASHLHHNSGISVSHQLLRGHPAERIAAHSKARHAGLIVMTSHGRGGLTRMWLGSVADQLLRLTETPVLLLKGDLGKPPVFSTVLLALDRSSLEGEVIKHGIAFASLAPGARIELVHVVEPPLPVMTGMAPAGVTLDPDLLSDAEKPARDHVEAIAENLRRKGMEVGTHLPVGVGVGGIICDVAERLRADLIVTGTPGWKGVRRLLLGSVADKLVRGAPCPVLVIPLAAALRRAGNAGKPARKRQEKVVLGV